MTPPVLAMDTSALIQRYVQGPDSDLVLESMDDATAWCASELARTELLLVLHRLAMTPLDHEAMWAAARVDWDAFHVVPVDQRCLSSAAELGARFGLGLVDAIHLAAADRLPKPVRYATFDVGQIPAAAELGLEVVTPFADDPSGGP